MEKYIENRFPRYFIFGESKCGNFVDIATAYDDTLVGRISRADAEKLIADRNKAIDAIVHLFNRYDLEYDDLDEISEARR